MFDADRPITSSEQDRLGRTTFAKYLARCMLDHKDPESLVIGLQGGWGSGKTSIINLMLEELHSASNNMFDDEKPIILNFSPWSYSGQGQIIYGFYRRLSLTIRQFEYLSNAEHISHLLELYMSFFTRQPIPKKFRQKKRLLSKLTTTKREDGLAWESGRDPTQVKAEINELLSGQNHKIIIIIDNISRLEDQEINQIFQIVKSMGDYINTIYLLSFDKEQVVRAMDNVHQGEGKRYLEKLVQLPFDVPAISTQDMEGLLFDRLFNVVRTAPEGRWDSAYWADLYYSSLKYFFNSSRDITRFVNSLGFSFPRVHEVVNPVDFVALTVLEIFEPAVFLAIAENKDLFTDLLDNVYVFDKDKVEKDKVRCDDIILRTSEDRREHVLQILILLFPRLRAMYSPAEPYYHSDTVARKNLRVCSPDVFDIYFRLSIPTGYMPESEFETILEAVFDEDSFSQALLRLNQDERVTKFLDLLDGVAAYKIEQSNVKNVISALLDSGDLFPPGLGNLLSFDTPMRIHRICRQLLRQFNTSAERLKILEHAINKANKSLYILIHEIIQQDKQHNESEDTYLPAEHRDLTAGEVDTLRKLVAEKIAYWARIGRLGEHPKLLPILYAWKTWGSETECRRFVQQLIREEKGLLEFLGAALQFPVDQAITKLEKSPEWHKHLDNITAFIPLEIIEPRAKEIFEGDNFEKLREREQLAVLIFLDLINAQTVKVIPKTTF